MPIPPHLSGWGAARQEYSRPACLSAVPILLYYTRPARPCCAHVSQVCSLLHQRYAEFTPLFIPALVLSATGQGGDAPEPTGGAPSAVAPSSAPSSAPASTQASRTARRRSAFRLLTELYLAGVVTETSVLVSALKDVVGAGVEAGAGKRAGGGGERWGDGREMGMGVPDREGLISALAVVVAFARSARVLLGLPVPKAEEEVRSPCPLSSLTFPFCCQSMACWGGLLCPVLCAQACFAFSFWADPCTHFYVCFCTCLFLCVLL